MPVIYLVSVELGVPRYGFVAPTYRFSLLSSGLLLSLSQQWQAKSFSCSISFGEGNGTPLQYSCLENPMDGGAWWAAVHGVTKSQTWLSNFTFTFHFHTLEKEMATQSSVLAWRTPGTGEPGGLPSVGSHRVGHDWSNLATAAAAPYLYVLNFLCPSSQFKEPHDYTRPTWIMWAILPIWM